MAFKHSYLVIDSTKDIHSRKTDQANKQSFLLFRQTIKETNHSVKRFDLDTPSPLLLDDV